MRRLVLIGLVAIAVAGCNQQSPQAPADKAPASQPPAAVTASTVAANPDFPEGLQPTFRYKLRSRGSEATADGNIRRLVIEFKEGDVASVDKAIEDLLVAKGYRRYKNFQQNDALVGDYGDHGKRVTVTTSPANGKLSLDPDSLGSVYFVWKE